MDRQTSQDLAPPQVVAADLLQTPLSKEQIEANERRVKEMRAIVDANYLRLHGHMMG